MSLDIVAKCRLSIVATISIYHHFVCESSEIFVNSLQNIPKLHIIQIIQFVRKGQECNWFERPPLYLNRLIDDKLYIAYATDWTEWTEWMEWIDGIIIIVVESWMLLMRSHRNTNHIETHQMI